MYMMPIDLSSNAVVPILSFVGTCRVQIGSLRHSAQHRYVTHDACSVNVAHASRGGDSTRSFNEPLLLWFKWCFPCFVAGSLGPLGIRAQRVSDAETRLRRG